MLVQHLTKEPLEMEVKRPFAMKAVEQYKNRANSQGDGQMDRVGY